MAAVDAPRVGPFADDPADFAHLLGNHIMLVVQSAERESTYAEHFTNRRPLDVRHDELLFDKLVRAVPFDDWSRLTGTLDGQSWTLYDDNGTYNTPELRREHARTHVADFHARLRALRAQVAGHLLLEVHTDTGEDDWTSPPPSPPQHATQPAPPPSVAALLAFLNTIYDP